MDLGGLLLEMEVVPVEVLPEPLINELLIAKHEFENVTIVTTCGAAVLKGCISGEVWCCS
jgi:hypothetical protein